MTSEPDVILASAKVNLFLHVGERRADGFHDLQSLAVFPAVGDLLRFAPSDRLSLALDGPFASVLAGHENLVLKAARALTARAGVKAGAKITLTKNLPVASGIGGGSSDAAAALRGLAALWGTGGEVLPVIAAEIGSDVPVCLAAKPAWMEGRGEILTPVEKIPPLSMLLVNPGIAVSTREVFARLAERRSASLPPGVRFEDTADLLRFLETTANDLEVPARVFCPVIGEVLDALGRLPGALFTRMSGSGASCFALFPDGGASARAAALLGTQYPKWWVHAGESAGIGMEEREAGTDIGPTPNGL